MPFGSRISFIPSETTTLGKERPTLSTVTVDGLFLGYRLQPGGRWRKYYHVIPLDACKEMPLTFTARKLGKFTNRITVNMDVKVTDSTVVYPLKAEADRANNDHWNGGVK